MAKNKINTINFRSTISLMNISPIFFFYCCILIGFSSCNLINPKESIPTYIQIDSVQLLPTLSATHGSISHKITDVWVYYNRQLLGPFELPCKVPVLATGTGQLQVVAGIWDNGLSGTRVKYPFYSVDTFTFSPSPTNIIKHTPTFIYRTTDTPLVKYFVEDFEQGNVFVKRSGDTTLIKTNQTNEVMEGDWSGLIDLHDSIKSAEVITSLEYFLSPNKECYMELNYKSEIPFIVRTEVYHLGSYISSDIIGLNAKDKWTKVYINLTGFAAAFQYGKFKFILKSSLPNTVSHGKIWIDNFKIIYFN